MRIVVADVKIDGEVTIDTGNGIIYGKWVGELPKEDAVIDIEVEIKDTLEWEKDIIKVDDDSYECGFINDTLFFVGCVESVDDDGYTVIRFGKSIICIDTIGIPFSEGEFVKLEVSKVELYNSNY